MKKIFLCILFITAITKTSAENIFDFSWNFGNIGCGINYSGSDDDSPELSVSFLNFIIEQKYINIGFEFNPVKYWHFFKFENELESKYNGERFSFINANMYWDLIGNNKMYFSINVDMLFVLMEIGIWGNSLQ
jgi:hypothetical protein